MSWLTLYHDAMSLLWRFLQTRPRFSPYFPKFFLIYMMQSRPDMVSIFDQFTAGQPPPHYKIVDSALFYKNRFCLSKDSCHKATLPREFHDWAIVGHAWVKRTLACLAAKFHWFGIRTDVQKYVDSCEVYQRIKYSTSPLVASSNLYQFQLTFGKTLRWTSSSAYRLWKGWPQF